MMKNIMLACFPSIILTILDKHKKNGNDNMQ